MSRWKVGQVRAVEMRDRESEGKILVEKVEKIIIEEVRENQESASMVMRVTMGGGGE